MTRLRLALLWSIAAVGVAFWADKLTAQAFAETWHALLLCPVIEETCKYLAIRRAKGYALLVPAVFVLGEAVVQQVTPFNVAVMGYRLPLAIALYSLLNLCALAHFLFYAPVALWGTWGLPVAVALHSTWNWYALLPEGQDAGPLGVLALSVAVLVPLALWRAENE